MDHWLISWTARACVVLYVAGLSLRITSTKNVDRRRVARWLWTLACGALAVHVVLAFHWTHGWSHAAALKATARETAAVTGWNWGGGLYVNYLCLTVWLVDVAWWWRGLDLYERRPRLAEWSIQAFLAFILFNATVVFKSGPTRWLGVVGTVVLLIAVGIHLRNRRRRSVCRPLEPVSCDAARAT